MFNIIVNTWSSGFKGQPVTNTSYSLSLRNINTLDTIMLVQLLPSTIINLARLDRTWHWLPRWPQEWNLLQTGNYARIWERARCTQSLAMLIFVVWLVFVCKFRINNVHLNTYIFIGYCEQLELITDFSI